MIILSYILIGVLSGFLAGLLGIGGGIILVPGLLAIFAHAGISSELQMHLATSTALASIILSSLVAVHQQQRNFTIHWDLLKQLAPGMILGVVTGALIALVLSTAALKLLFSLFLFFVAFGIFFNTYKIDKKETTRLTTLKKWSIGILIGSASGLMGIGGGAVAVPLLLRLGLSPHHAIGTSSACILLLSIVGVFTFTIIGLHVQNLPVGSSGFVYWPAVIGVSCGSMLMVPVGARLGKRLTKTHLRKIFALFLIGIAINMAIH